MDFLSRMFGGMVRQKKQQYSQRATARVRANTVGKVQAKMLKAQAKMDQKVNKAQDNALKGKFKGDGKGKGKGGGGGAVAGGGAAGGGGGAVAGGGGGQQRGPVPIAQRQQAQQAQHQRASVAERTAGPRGGPMPAAASCPNCNSQIRSDFEFCPYCHTQLAAAVAAVAAPMSGGGPQPYQPQDDGDSTMAVDLSALQAAGSQNRPVVGWIVAQSGNHRGHDFRLFDGKNTLGTAADCDIVITDPYLSAKHSTIRHEDGNFVLIDLDSTNGTYVNQKRVSKMELIDNDTIRFGRTEFKFKALF